MLNFFKKIVNNTKVSHSDRHETAAAYNTTSYEDSPIASDGFCVQDAETILNTPHVKFLLQKITIAFGCSQKIFDQNILPSIKQFILFVQNIPAAESDANGNTISSFGHHEEMYGLLLHSLETMYFALNDSRLAFFNSGVSPTSREQNVIASRIACGLSGLLHDIGKIADVIIVTKIKNSLNLYDEVEWCCIEPLVEFLADVHQMSVEQVYELGNKGPRYYIKGWRKGRSSKHEAIAPFLMRNFVSKGTLKLLSQSQTKFIDDFMLAVDWRILSPEITAARKNLVYEIWSNADKTSSIANKRKTALNAVKPVKKNLEIKRSIVAAFHFFTSQTMVAIDKPDSTCYLFSYASENALDFNFFILLRFDENSEIFIKYLFNKASEIYKSDILSGQEQSLDNMYQLLELCDFLVLPKSSSKFFSIRPDIFSEDTDYFNAVCFKSWQDITLPASNFYIKNEIVFKHQKVCFKDGIEPIPFEIQKNENNELDTAARIKHEDELLTSDDIKQQGIDLKGKGKENDNEVPNEQSSSQNPQEAYQNTKNEKTDRASYPAEQYKTEAGADDSQRTCDTGEEENNNNTEDGNRQKSATTKDDKEFSADAEHDAVTDDVNNGTDTNGSLEESDTASKNDPDCNSEEISELKCTAPDSIAKKESAANINLAESVTDFVSLSTDSDCINTEEDEDQEIEKFLNSQNPLLGGFVGKVVGWNLSRGINAGNTEDLEEETNLNTFQNIEEQTDTVMQDNLNSLKSLSSIYISEGNTNKDYRQALDELCNKVNDEKFRNNLRIMIEKRIANEFSYIDFITSDEHTCYAAFKWGEGIKKNANAKQLFRALADNQLIANLDFGQEKLNQEIFYFEHVQLSKSITEIFLLAGIKPLKIKCKEYPFVKLPGKPPNSKELIEYFKYRLLNLNYDEELYGYKAYGFVNDIKGKRINVSALVNCSKAFGEKGHTRLVKHLSLSQQISPPYLYKVKNELVCSYFLN